MKFLPLAIALSLTVSPALLHAQSGAPAPSTPAASAAASCVADSDAGSAAGTSGASAHTAGGIQSDRPSADQDSKHIPEDRPATARKAVDATASFSATANCPPSSAPDALQVAANCSKVQVVNFEAGYDGEPSTVPIWRHADDSAFFYESGMTIDADGAPNAYHPDNIGLDDLANAGGPGDWPGLAKDRNGDPIIQGPNDPYPGYYVSATALADRDKPFNDPTRYVDATKIPFIVLPGALAMRAGARTGDFAVVFNLRNGKSSPAIFADVGPADHIGEGSVALAENLGIRSDARNGGTRGEIVWLVFAGSGNGRPRPIDEINSEANRLLEAWGGAVRLNACMADGPSGQ